ncbi:MAG: GDSL-type esterase/lipase family protein [Tepidisphaeraceae bacterium]
MTDQSAPAAGPPSTRRRRRWLRWCILGVVVGLVGVELFSRAYLGLGDPPLLMSDPEIEYLYRPSQTGHRFGNLIHYNAYSMRSSDFPAHKIDPSELRVLVIGDSVINGGAQTDQSQVCTERLGESLSVALRRKVVVGNISAQSWGPPNMLAYLRRFGLFDADVLVIVVASHDAEDVPTFKPVVGVQRDFPDHKPLTATGELVSRYLWPMILGMTVNDSGPIPVIESNQAAREQGLLALREMIRLARASGARVVVAQHLERTEALGTLRPEHDLIARLASEEGAQVIQLGPAFAASLRSGLDPYRDIVHPNTVGQRLIGRELFNALEPMFRNAPASRPLDTRPDRE